MGLKQLHMLHTVSCKSQLQLLFGEKNTRSALLKCCHLRVCACVWKGFFTMRPHRHHPPWTPSSNPNQTSGCWLWGAVPTTAAQQLDLSIWSKCNCWSSYICCIHSCQICIIYIYYATIVAQQTHSHQPQPSSFNQKNDMESHFHPESCESSYKSCSSDSHTKPPFPPSAPRQVTWKRDPRWSQWATARALRRLVRGLQQREELVGHGGDQETCPDHPGL